ncbi:uncharacterized protein [Eurosta solidaginis]|uniref:uncharacterized protein isoform X2 n=1 Tax=Eurosta solidaginis TaxID=178769 RepID=UPI003530EFC0
MNCFCFSNRSFCLKWNNSLNKKLLRFVFFIFCLINYQKIIYGKEARIQRRFMWKQMHMENLMRNALSDLVPTINSVKPNKALNYLPSETTRIKYIIRNPTTNQPMKIIKIRPTTKIVKIIPKPNIGFEPKLILRQHNKPAPTYPTSDEMKKIEMEQELLTEGRISLNNENEIFNHIPDRENYTEQPKQEIDEKYNSWLPVAETSKISSFSSIKPSMVTSLHTSIVAEPLQGQEKPIPKQKSIFFANDKENNDFVEQQKYYDNTRHSNGYEVTENIAEESIALPLISDSQIRLPIGTAPSTFSSIQTTNKQVANRETNIAPIAESSSSVDMPNYPANFLRRYRERSKLSADLPIVTSTAPTLRIQQQKNTADLNTPCLPKVNNITNNRETFKIKGRFHGMSSHVQNEKWAPNVPDRFSTYEKPAETKVWSFTSTTPPATSSAESGVRSAGRLKTQLPMSTPTKISQNANIRELRQHNRGRIKFGDKILTE